MPSSLITQKSVRLVRKKITRAGVPYLVRLRLPEVCYPMRLGLIQDFHRFIPNAVLCSLNERIKGQCRFNFPMNQEKVHCCDRSSVPAVVTVFIFQDGGFFEASRSITASSTGFSCKVGSLAWTINYHVQIFIL